MTTLLPTLIISAYLEFDPGVARFASLTEELVPEAA
jgi:hypothetical protein